MVRQYVGARYVPKFADPTAWTSGTSYEAMTIVTYNNSSYTSKMPVPATVGNPADNPDYWALTGNYNAQVEQYRQETEKVSNNLTTEITNRKNADTTLQGQVTTVSNNLTTEITNRKDADTTLQGQVTTVSNTLTTEITNRKNADTTLQASITQNSARISNLVANTGDSNSEIVDARVGSNGTTYTTLGDAIRNAEISTIQHLGCYTEPTYKTGYISSTGSPSDEGQNTYGIFYNVQYGDVIIITADTSGYWDCAFGLKKDGTTQVLLGQGRYTNKSIIITDSDIIEVRAWSLSTTPLSMKIVGLKKYINDNASAINDANRDVYAVPNVINGYLNDIGAWLGGGDDGNCLVEFHNVKKNDVFVYTGGYSSWPVVFGYKKDGTVVTLLEAGNFANKEITITDDDITTVRAWGNTKVSPYAFKFYKKGNTLVDTLVKEKGNKVVVDINGNGDFTDIASALAYMQIAFDVQNKPCELYIRNGVYTVSPTSTHPFYALDKGSNRISIRGESRDQTIIRCTCTSELQGIALNIGGPCTIENLTVENLADSSYTESTILEGQHRPYCIHNDTHFTTDNDYYTVIKNVKCYSECGPCIGAGLQNKQTQRYENVECHFAKGAVEHTQGALYVHGPNLSGAVANGIEVVDCVLINEADTARAISLPDVAGMQPYSQIKQTFVRNIVASSTYDAVYIASADSKTIICAGNNDAVLNYTK